MSSWQNRVLSRVITLRIKRKPSGDDARNVALIRAKLHRMPFYAQPTIPAGLIVEWVDGGDSKGEWLEWRSQARATPTVLYLHGGGYVACTPVTHRPITVALTTLLRGRVYCPDYRLAPEHRFPAAVDDAVAAYRLLLDEGIDPRHIVIAGDSAGGGLALATLIALREGGAPLPAAAVCLSPWTDLAGTGESLVTNTDRDAMFYGDGVRQASRVYLGDTPPEHPLASPLYADLTGLPPLRLYVSECEVLRDDSTRLVERARKAGVTAELVMEPDLPHVWPIFQRFLPEGRRTLRDMAAFIRKHTQ